MYSDLCYTVPNSHGFSIFDKQTNADRKTDQCYVSGFSFSWSCPTVNRMVQAEILSFLVHI